MKRFLISILASVLAVSMVPAFALAEVGTSFNTCGHGSHSGWSRLQDVSTREETGQGERLFLEGGKYFVDSTGMTDASEIVVTGDVEICVDDSLGSESAPVTIFARGDLMLTSSDGDATLYGRINGGSGFDLIVRDMTLKYYALNWGEGSVIYPAGNFELQDVNIEAEGEIGCVYVPYGVKGLIDGGKFTSETTDGVGAIRNQGSLTIENANVTSSESAGISNDGEQMTLKDVSVESYGTALWSESDVEVVGGSLRSTGVYSGSGDIGYAVRFVDADLALSGSARLFSSEEGMPDVVLSGDSSVDIASFDPGDSGEGKFSALFTDGTLYGMGFAKVGQRSDWTNCIEFVDGWRSSSPISEDKFAVRDGEVIYCPGNQDADDTTALLPNPTEDNSLQLSTGTYRLGGDFALSDQVLVSGNVVIDVAGYALAMPQGVGEAFELEEESSLRVTSSVAGGRVVGDLNLSGRVTLDHIVIEGSVANSGNAVVEIHDAALRANRDQFALVQDSDGAEGLTILNAVTLESGANATADIRINSGEVKFGGGYWEWYPHGLAVDVSEESIGKPSITFDNLNSDILNYPITAVNENVVFCWEGNETLIPRVINLDSAQVLSDDSRIVDGSTTFLRGGIYKLTEDTVLSKVSNEEHEWLYVPENAEIVILTNGHSLELGPEYGFEVGGNLEIRGNNANKDKLISYLNVRKGSLSLNGLSVEGRESDGMGSCAVEVHSAGSLTAKNCEITSPLNFYDRSNGTIKNCVIGKKDEAGYDLTYVFSGSSVLFDGSTVVYSRISLDNGRIELKGNVQFRNGASAINPLSVEDAWQNPEIFFMGGYPSELDAEEWTGDEALALSSNDPFEYDMKIYIDNAEENADRFQYVGGSGSWSFVENNEIEGCLDLRKSKDEEGSTGESGDSDGGTDGDSESGATDSGAGGGVGGGSAVPADPEGEVVENPDGSTTTIVKNADGTTTEITDAADGSVTVVVEKDGNGSATSIGAVVSEKAAGSDKAVALPMSPVEAVSSVKAVGIKVSAPEGIGAVKVTVPVAKAEGDGAVAPGAVLVLVGAEGNEAVLPKTVAGETGLTAEVLVGATIKVVDASTDFSDVEEGAWYAEQGVADFVSARGIMTGVVLPGGAVEFQGDETTSRGMFVTMLHRLEMAPDSESDASFGDVAADSWYADSAAWAVEQGITTGKIAEDNSASFDGEGIVTREQMATFLFRYAQAMGLDTSARAEGADLSGVSDFALDAVSWAVATGLIKGDDGTGAIRPADGATRAEAAVVVMRMIELLVR